MKRLRTNRRVGFADCDPAKIVYYPRFYEWFDRSTESLFHSVAIDWVAMMGEDGWGGVFMGMPLVATEARYTAPCRYGDEIVIESWIDAIKGRTFTVRHDIHNHGRVVVEGREVRVWAVKDEAHPAGMRAVPMPDRVIGLFEA